MTAVVVDGRGGIDVVEKAVPSPGPGEVLIAVEATGICGTDLHLIEGSYAHGRYPVTPGHEFSGTVAAVGRGVTRVAEGDHVGVDPNISCGTCRWCTGDAKNLCETLDPVGISVDGSCAEYVVVPQDVAHRLPRGIDDTTGPLVEPLSCVLHAVARAPRWGGARIAVYGAGPIGLLAVAVARHLGAGQITAFEPHDLRRGLAVGVGADTAYADAGEVDEADEYDIAIEASGHPRAIQQAVDGLGRRGRLVQMGVAHPDVGITVSPYEVFAKELTIIGSNSLAGSYPEAVELMPDLAERLRPLVTDRLPLREYAKAVDLAGSSASIKVQVVSS